MYEPFKGSEELLTNRDLYQGSNLQKPPSRLQCHSKFCCILGVFLLVFSLASMGLSIVSYLELKRSMNALSNLVDSLTNAHNTLNATTMDQLNDLQSSANTLNATTTILLSAAETSREQLQAMIQTNHDSFLAQASQIENTVSTNQQSILNRTNQIENTVSTNHQSMLSRAAQIESTVNTNYNSVINSRGVTYIRWGHNTCPSGRTTVYSGRVGGTAYSLQGGASNQVCLPEDPQYYDLFRSGFQGHSIMYGSEYEQPLSSNAATQDNVPCAVCLVTTRQQVLMIPARYTCPSGWTREYNGYLMSERVSNHRSTFICVDANQIPIPYTRVHNLATDLYHVEADCSNLPCGPYSSEKELSCVVCTK